MPSLLRSDGTPLPLGSLDVHWSAEAGWRFTAWAAGRCDSAFVALALLGVARPVSMDKTHLGEERTYFAGALVMDEQRSP
jgi:hypothetical protein